MPKAPAKTVVNKCAHSLKLERKHRKTFHSMTTCIMLKNMIAIQCLTPVIPVTQEAEIRRISV
jgi:hypothetical protein